MVTVTVTVTGQKASPGPPTHAFLRLLVLGPALQVSHAYSHLRPHSLRGGPCRLNLGTDILTASLPSPQDPLAAPAHSSGPILTSTSPASTLVTQGRTGGGRVDKPWWGTVGGVLLLLGLASW